MKFSILAIGILSVFFLEPRNAIAQQSDTSATPTETKTDTEQTTVLDSLTYIFSGEDRSEKFARLRRARSELSRKINIQEAQIRELQQQNADIEERLKSMRSASASALPLSSAGFSFEDEELSKAKFDREQTIKRFDLEEKTAKDRISKFKEKLSNPSVSTMEKESIQQDIANLEERTKSMSDEKDLRLGENDFQISALEKRNEIRLKQFSQIKAESDARITSAKAEIESSELILKENNKKISDMKSTLTSLYTEIENIDSDILNLIEIGDADSWFKIVISLTFAALVALIIFGFYRTAGRDSEIVKSIFSNDSGIQFITLFSIVIAVILFGIIGVLEGKELSALLGGLSGYILGRGTVGTKAGEGPATAAGATNGPAPANTPAVPA